MKTLVIYIMLMAGVSSVFAQAGSDCNNAILIEDTIYIPESSTEAGEDTWYRFKPRSGDIHIAGINEYILYEGIPYGFCYKVANKKIKPVRKFIPEGDTIFGKGTGISEEELSGKCGCYTCLSKSTWLPIDGEKEHYLLVNGQPDTILFTYKYPKLTAKEKAQAEQPVKEEVKKPKIAPKLSSVKAEDLNVGATIEIDNLFFLPGSVRMQKESIEGLSKLYEFLDKNKTLTVKIQGHVNGTPGKNTGYFQKLSQDRAKLVYDYLLAKGIGKGRVSFEGLGNSSPRFSEPKTPEEQAQNRRVEVLVVSK